MKALQMLYIVTGCSYVSFSTIRKAMFLQCFFQCVPFFITSGTTKEGCLGNSISDHAGIASVVNKFNVLSVSAVAPQQLSKKPTHVSASYSLYKTCGKTA